jgi:ATP-dependent RNA helicase DHX8/PRP22
MSQLEGVAAKKREGGSRPVAADFDGGRQTDGEGPSKRPRYEEGNGRDAARGDDADRGRPRARDNGYGSGDRGGYGGGYGGRPQMDEKPVLYKIYDGKVSGWKDFGAFVSLEGLKGRFEGVLASLTRHLCTLGDLD